MQLIKKYAPLLLILTLTVATYFVSLKHGFTHLDDYEQVVNNPNIKGLSTQHIKAIFSSISVGMYQPMTTLFYAITYNLFGKEAANFHTLSLLFHLINIVLVYILLKKFNIKKNQAILFSAIFALHPMQVESISWVSAFSNLTYSCFYLLAVIYYRSYTQGNKKAYFLTILFFLFSLFSKSTAVTLPLVLLALDYFQHQKFTFKSLLNKIPFFILSFIFGLITIFSRESAGHLSDLSIQFNWFERLFLIAYSFLFYPFKWIFPLELSVFYPYPEISNGLLPLIYYLSLPILISLLFIIWKKRENKLLLFGALFYLLTIAIIVQIIPVGNQLTTDRYIYLPMFGLFLILYSLIGSKQLKIQSITLGVFTLLFMILSIQRSKVWANDGLIWEDVIKKHPTVAQAYNNLGSFELQNGNAELAFRHFNKAVELKPYYADALSNRGNLYSQMGEAEKAIADYNHAIAHRPHADAYFNRANEYSRMGEYQKAIEDYQASSELKESADTYTNWAYTLMQKGEIATAKDKLDNALKLDSKFTQALFLNGIIFQQEGNITLACQYFRKAEQERHPQASMAIQRFCK